MRGQDLDGDGPLQPRIGGFVDLTHPPGPDGGLDGIRAEAGAALKGHGLSVKSGPIVGRPAGGDNGGSNLGWSPLGRGWGA